MSLIGIGAMKDRLRYNLPDCHSFAMMVLRHASIRIALEVGARN